MQNFGQPLPEAGTDGKATTSMILGILSMLLCFFGWIAGIPAIILGHISRSNIRKSMGRLRGDGMALAGLIMGYVSVAGLPFMLIFAAVAIPNFIRGRQSANESSAVATIRSLVAAEASFQSSNPDAGYAPDIETVAPEVFSLTCAGNWCTKNGYRFTIQADDQKPHQAYVITALPVKANNTGGRDFCAGSDAVLRYQRPASGRTTPFSAEECAALAPVDEMKPISWFRPQARPRNQYETAFLAERRL
jgi:hypothetical protein